MSELVAGTSGFGAYLARHPVVVEEALSQKEAHRKVHALEVLARVKAPVPPFANILASLAVSSAKTVREAAGQILAGFTGARAALEVKAREGDPGERGEAASLLVRLAGDAARAFLEERLAAEGSPKVKRIVEELLHGPAAAAAVATEEWSPSLAPLPFVDPHAPLSASAQKALRDLLVGLSNLASEFWEKHSTDRKYLKEPRRVTESDVSSAIRSLTDLVVDRSYASPFSGLFHDYLEHELHAPGGPVRAAPRPRADPRRQAPAPRRRRPDGSTGLCARRMDGRPPVRRGVPDLAGRPPGPAGSARTRRSIPGRRDRRTRRGPRARRGRMGRDAPRPGGTGGHVAVLRREHLPHRGGSRPRDTPATRQRVHGLDAAARGALDPRHVSVRTAEAGADAVGSRAWDGQGGSDRGPGRPRPRARQGRSPRGGDRKRQGRGPGDRGGVAVAPLARGPRAAPSPGPREGNERTGEGGPLHGTREGRGIAGRVPRSEKAPRGRGPHPQEGNAFGSLFPAPGDLAASTLARRRRGGRPPDRGFSPRSGFQTEEPGPGSASASASDALPGGGRTILGAHVLNALGPRRHACPQPGRSRHVGATDRPPDDPVVQGQD